MNLQDRARGVMVGLACGDALGAPLEFQSQNALRSRYGGIVRDFIDTNFSGRTLNAGEITDDTEMALALARAIVRDGQYNPETVLANYLEWMETNPPDVGNTISFVLKAVKADMQADTTMEDMHREMMEAAGREYISKRPKTLEAAALARASDFHTRSRGQSAGNGSLMRIAPLAIPYSSEDKLKEVAFLESSLTHYDPLAGEACFYFLQRISAYLEGKESIYLSSSYPPVALASMSSYEKCEEAAAEKGGFVLTGIAIAEYADRQGMSYEEGVVWAANMGGDADTNAAITGALLGARDGLTGIPSRFKDNVSHRAELISLADNLAALR